MSPSQHCISGLQFGFSYLLKFEKKKFLVGFKWEIKKWKPTDCPIVSLIIKISWLLIPLIHLLKKALPVSSILGQVTFIYYHPPPLSHTHTHTHTHTIQSCEKPLDPRNDHEEKFGSTKFPGEKKFGPMKYKGTMAQTHQTHEI